MQQGGDGGDADNTTVAQIRDTERGGEGRGYLQAQVLH
jgi:hypothetical protein